MQFYLTCLRGIEYFAKEPELVGAECFWPLGARAARKKIPGARAGAEVAWEKIKSRSRLKKIQEPEPEPLKNFTPIQVNVPSFHPYSRVNEGTHKFFI